MIIKDKIRHKISQQLNIVIPPNKWVQYIELLDRDGIPNRKQLIGVFMIMAQHLEMFEGLFEDLYGQKPTPQPDFKLRTAKDIYAELEAAQDPSTTAFYVSSSDWGILEKAIDPALAKTKPEYGFGKEKDPKDGTEKTCLYFHDLPIFKG